MKQIKKLIALAAVLCLLLAALPAALAEEPEDTPTPEERFKDKTWEQVIDEFLTEHHVDAERLGLGYYNTVTGEEEYLNPDTYFIAASMFKVPLNMLYCEKVSSGEIDWDTNIWGYRYEYLLRGTIIESNNELAETLWRAYGVGQFAPYRYYREQIAPYMGEDAETVDATYYRNNLFTSRQMIHCLRLLYENPDRFPKLLDTMKEAEPNRYFKNHPQKVEVAHKYGYVVEDDFLYLNDCGVCYTEDPICIVAFTKGAYHPYAVLADYCTLMIDYTEYHTAERHERELEEARQEAIRAMTETPAETESPEPVAAVSPVPGAAVTEAPVVSATPAPAQKTEKGTPVIGLIFVSAFAVLGIAAVIRAAHKKQLRAVWGILCVIAVSLALLVCISAHRMTPAITASEPLGDPQDCVTDFLDAIVAHKYQIAYDCLYDYATLGLEEMPEGEAAQMMAKALQDSYSYSLYGDCEVKGLQAKQKLLFEMLDLTALREDLKTGTEAAVKKMSEELPESEVVDEEGNYRPEITERAYLETLSELLEHPTRYRTSVGVELELRYTVKGWRILTGRDLLYALSGCTAYTGGGDKA